MSQNLVENPRAEDEHPPVIIQIPPPPPPQRLALNWWEAASPQARWFIQGNNLDQTRFRYQAEIDFIETRLAEYSVRKRNWGILFFLTWISASLATILSSDSAEGANVFIGSGIAVTLVTCCSIAALANPADRIIEGLMELRSDLSSDQVTEPPTPQSEEALEEESISRSLSS